MIVLHALWVPGEGLSVWGERGGRASSRRGPPRGARPHPFACAADDLHGALGGETAEPTSQVVLLPSTSRAPAPSPELVRHGERAPGRPEIILPWVVPAVALDAAAATELLLDLDSARGVRVDIGRSLAYLGEVAKLALELTAGGRILPGMEHRGDSYVACWRPLLTAPPDAVRVRMLERTMPPACRAAARDDRGNAARDPAVPEESLFLPLPTAPQVLADALAVLTDGCARASLPTLPFPLARRATRALRTGHAFLRALAGPDGTVRGEPDELSTLQERLEKWMRTAIARTAQPYRTCFRLSSPRGLAGIERRSDETPGRVDDEDGEESDTDDRPDAAPTWRLDFLLQRTDDPSLLLPAEEVWSAPVGAGALLNGEGETPQEVLLRDLGLARRHLPEILPALRTARPTGIDLDAEQAYRFLRQATPLLRLGGMEVMVPSWWHSVTPRLGLRLHVRARQQEEATSPGGLGLNALCAYEWRLALGDEALSAEEFRELARRKQPLLRIRGQWVVLDPDEVEAALTLLRSRRARGTMTALEVLRLSAETNAGPAGDDLPVAGIDVDRGASVALEALLTDDDRIERVAPPAEFAGILRPYQERGLAWMAFLDDRGIGACLADDMGLGKTIQLLALLLARPPIESPPVPTLLVCPMSVVGNWQHEAARFAPTLRVLVHHGSDRREGEAFLSAVADADLVITTYALAARDRDALAEVQWHRVVLDEAQNIKNASALQSRAVRSLSASRRIALTGTPVENRLTELWSIMDFLNPGLLGSQRDFRERFARPIERFRDEQQAERLRRLTRPFILRRVKTDRSIIDDLPEKQEMRVYCNLTREQATLYQAVVDDMLRRVEESEGIERRGLILSTMLKLKQVCNHPAQLLRDRSALPNRSGKLALLEEVLEEALGIGDRCLVFTQFAEMGEMLQRHLHRKLGSEVLYLHGGTPRAARDEMVRRFQAKEGPPVFILSLKAGGTGLNLTAANQVVHFDRWWNPAVENQATDRAFRIGQKRSVQVRKLVCTGTLEERIDDMIERKKELAERIVGAGEGWLTELSNAELREVVRLSADAVAE